MPSRVPIAAKKVRLAAIALQKIREENKIIRKHLPALRKFFNIQRDLVIDEFKQLETPLKEAAEAKLSKAAPIPNAILQTAFEKSWGNVEEATTEDLQNLILKIEHDGMKAGGDLLKDSINPGGIKPESKMWSLENPRAVAWFQKNGGSLQYIKDIQATTKSSLQRIIITGLDEGWSYTEIGKEIQKLYDGPISRERAQLIATHEAAQAYEAGNREFAVGLADDGIKMEKRWENSGDDRVTDGCLENTADGWIPIDEPHTSGDQNPPRFPGCRCWESYRQAQEGKD